MPSYHYGSSSYGGQRRRRRAPRGSRVLAVLALFILAAGLGFGIYKGVGLARRWVHEVMDDPVPTKTDESPAPEESTEEEKDYGALIRTADGMAVQYDYDGAIALLQQAEGYGKNEQLSAALTRLNRGFRCSNPSRWSRRRYRKLTGNLRSFPRNAGSRDACIFPNPTAR